MRQRSWDPDCLVQGPNSCFFPQESIREGASSLFRARAGESPNRLLLYPDLLFLAFWDFLAFLFFKEFLAFLSVFHFFSKDLRGSEEMELFWWFSFSRKSKEKKIRVEQPQGCTGASLGCSRARGIFVTFRPSPEKTTFSFPYRFSGKTNRKSGLVPGNQDPNKGAEKAPFREAIVQNGVFESPFCLLSPWSLLSNLQMGRDLLPSMFMCSNNHFSEGPLQPWFWCTLK